MPHDADDLPAGLPRNFLRPCLLLLIAEQPSHGYDLVVRLVELGFRRSDPGGLYRTLRVMEQEGLISSSWESSELGPPRRTYWISEEGADWLHAWAGSLRGAASVIGSFLGRYESFVTAESEIARQVR